MSMDETKGLEPTVKKGKKAKTIAISILAVIVAIAVAFVMSYFNGAAAKTCRQLKKGEYSAAETMYRNNVESSFLQRTFAKSKLTAYGEKVAQQYKDGKISYEKASDILASLKNMGFDTMASLGDEIASEKDAEKAFTDAEKFYKNGDIENAIKEYSKIPEGSDNYATAQKKLVELYPQYINNVAEKANQLNMAGNCKEALSVLNLALSLMPDANIDLSKLESAKTVALNSYKEQTLNEITYLIGDQKFSEAIALADEALKLDDNEEFRNSKTTAETKYVEYVTANVNEMMSQGDYISAKRNVEDAIKTLPNNMALRNLKTTVERATPVFLLDVCQPYSKYQYKEYVNGESFPMGGKNYSNGFVLTEGWDPGNAVFNVEGKYKTLSFMSGHVDDTNGGSARIKIYCDGVIKKEYVIEREDLPKKIEIDITGVKSLKFELCEGNGNYGFGNVAVR